MDNNKGYYTMHIFLRVHLLYHIVIIIAGLIFLIGSPLFILNPDQAKAIFNNGMPGVVVAFFLQFLAAFVAVIGGIYWILVALKKPRAGAAVAVFLFSWLAISSFLLPLTTADGMFDLADGPTNLLNLGLVFLLASLATYGWLSRFSNIVIVLMATFVIASIAPTIQPSISKFEKNTGRSHIQLSEKSNVIVMGFDGLPGHIAQQVIMQNASLKEAFKDFTFFENATASSPATSASLMGIIHGNNDFITGWKKPYRVDWRKLYFNNNTKYEMYTNSKYDQYNRYGVKITAAQFGPKSQRRELLTLYKSITLRIATKFGVRAFLKIEDWFYPVAPGRYDATVEGFEDTISILNNEGGRIGIVYMHFLFTHFPIVVDQNCAYRGNDSNWKAANQNEQGVINSTACGMKKYADMIAKLKALGIYDNTLIVLNSDHGKPAYYYSAPPYNLRINNHPIWGFDRYRPLLMVKGRNTTQDAMNVNSKNVLLDDIAQTVCNSVEDRRLCEYTPGVNLLDKADEFPKEFFIHVVKSEKSTWMRDSHEAVRLSRTIPLEEAMRQSSQIKLTETSTVSIEEAGGYQPINESTTP